jgi:hypothetical protein
MSNTYMTVIERKGRNTIDRQFFNSEREALEWVEILSGDTVSAQVYSIDLIKQTGALAGGSIGEVSI